MHEHTAESLTQCPYVRCMYTSSGKKRNVIDSNFTASDRQDIFTTCCCQCVLLELGENCVGVNDERQVDFHHLYLSEIGDVWLYIKRSNTNTRNYRYVDEVDACLHAMEDEERIIESRERERERESGKLSRRAIFHAIK